MAKRKKTKKQKLAADMRRHGSSNQPSLPEQNLPVNLPTFAVPTYSLSTSQEPMAVVHTKRSSYDTLVTYLPKDLRKTASITIVIFAVEIVLALILNHSV